MDWIRVDVAILRDPKLLAVGRDGFVLYLFGLTYAGELETDGWIFEAALNLCPWIRNPGKVADSLVIAGLWERTDTGYQIHAYTKRQPTKADLDAERSKRDAERVAARERMRRIRSGPARGSPDVRANVRDSFGERSRLDVTLREQDVTEDLDPGPDSLATVGSSEGVQGEPDGFAAEQDQGEDLAAFGEIPDRAAYLWSKVRRSTPAWRATWPLVVAEQIAAVGPEPVLEALEVLAQMPPDDLAAVARPRAYLIRTINDHATKGAANPNDNGTKVARKRTRNAS